MQTSTQKSASRLEKSALKQDSIKEAEIASTPLRRDDDQRKGQQTTVMTDPTKPSQPKTVTPPEVGVKEDNNDSSSNNEKQVRFGGEENGGGGGGPVLEFKTYRSPPRKSDEEVPSLCSTSSEPSKKKTTSKVSTIPTTSISVDPSNDTTSPLASSHEAEKDEKYLSTRSEGGKYEVSDTQPRLFSFCSMN
jgi:hypothetical protein